MSDDLTNAQIALLCDIGERGGWANLNGPISGIPA